ncbi:MAG: GGDEF domain-containing protein [Gammaproteobacteria bacterium]|nr:GGDEF domain-containing protein [Gammaproteobacteria bacterium]
MNKEKPIIASDYRTKTTLGLALTTLIFLSPFGVAQFVQGNIVLGAFSLVVIVLFAINAWNCKRGQYNFMLTYIGLVPAIIIFFVYAFHTAGVISIFWCFPAVLAFYFMLPERQAWIANIAFIVIVLPQAWMTLEFELAIRLLVSVTMVSIFSAIFVRVISEQQKTLEKQAQVDPLTGLLNRTLLHQTLEHAIHQNRAGGHDMTLISLDIDHFKSINDTQGHSVGDSILRDIGQYLNQHTLSSDKVFRIGGEEFLVVLLKKNLQQGLRMAEELRVAIASLTVPLENDLTVSIGVATLELEEGWDNWMKRCDDNLYRAKNAGRNQVMA